MVLVLHLVLVDFVCSFVDEYLAYQIGLIVSEFYDALTSRHYVKFVWTVRFAVLYVFSISLVIAAQSIISGHLAFLLRDCVTTHLQKYYFQAKRYYTINALIDLDNPDQRFTQDLGTISTVISELLPTLLINPVLVVFYTYKCVELAGWLGPLSAFCLFIVFTILTKLVTNWTSATIYEHDRQEGNFRFLHTQLRSSCESAAFLDLGPSEYYFTTQALNRLLHAFRVSVNRKSVLQFITITSAYLGGIITYLALGIVLFQGMYSDLTSNEITVLISKTSFFLLYLINKLTSLIDLANKLVQLVGVGHRILTLNECILNCLSHPNPASYMAATQPAGAVVVMQQNFIENSALDGLPLHDVIFYLEHVSIAVPPTMQRVLIQNLNLAIRLHEPLLITGPSGAGKTAILRTLANLWPALVAPKFEEKNCYFYRSTQFSQVYIPQNPFVPLHHACPHRLLLDAFPSLGLRTMESNMYARALHMTYVLLRMCERPLPPMSRTLKTYSDQYATSVLAENEAFDDSEPDSLVNSEFQTNCHRLCGYSVKSYIRALELLSEFHLVTPILASSLNHALLCCTPRVNIVPKQSCPHFIISALTWITNTVKLGCSSTPPEGIFETGDLHYSYSPGELQRILLASVCYRCPHVVFLDEATSQLNAEDAKQAYTSLQARLVTCVSVAHQSSVRAFHRKELQLYRRTLGEEEEEEELDNGNSQVQWRLVECNL